MDRRAPVQSNYHKPPGQRRPPGTIAWEEHLRAWRVYAKTWGRDQSAERMAERGGFDWDELVMFLGHEPRTWEPRNA